MAFRHHTALDPIDRASIGGGEGYKQEAHLENPIARAHVDSAIDAPFGLSLKAPQPQSAGDSAKSVANSARKLSLRGKQRTRMETLPAATYQARKSWTELIPESIRPAVGHFRMAPLWG